MAILCIALFEVKEGMMNITDMVEVTLTEPDDFLKVRETLTRIGVASRKDKKLFQSCHILHKQGKYYLVHFKELFSLDGKPTNFGESDIARRNTIANLLAEWGLINVVDPQKTKARLRFYPIKKKTNGIFKRSITLEKRKQVKL
jgi:hypothetical protein